jgi:hypothetical protein
MSSKGRGRKKHVEDELLAANVSVCDGQCVAVVIETMGGNLQRVRERARAREGEREREIVCCVG